MFDGGRVNPTYDPMRKQGGILLGNGGDNSVGSQGTFYEGAMTAAGTFPTDATDRKVQANVVARSTTSPGFALHPPRRSNASGTTDVRAGLLTGLHRDLPEHHRGACVGAPPESFRSGRVDGCCLRPCFVLRSGSSWRQRERDLQGHLGTDAFQRRPACEGLVDRRTARSKPSRRSKKFATSARSRSTSSASAPAPTRPTLSSSCITPAPAPSTSRTGP